ncbi:MAG: hypothetical protein IJ848_00670 [Alphaproteobacteria bacterium]|nr:hypothetical protein [Alphaproteobacteria bacterium]
MNAILNGKHIINDVTILNTVLANNNIDSNSSNTTQKEDPNSKASRLDIEAVTDTGTIVNVELPQYMKH